MTKKRFKSLAINAYYRTIDPIRKLYWFIARPHHRGAKAVFFWEGKVLLARLSYGHKGWTFPGGGVGRHESFHDAALREAREEVGVEVRSAEFFYEYHRTLNYREITVQCFAATTPSGGFRVDEQEVTEAGWFAPELLPAGVRPNVKEILLKYSEWQKNRV